MNGKKLIMQTHFKTTSAEETRALGKKIAEKVRPGALLCLSGELGAGKTTFTQGFLQGLGAEPPYISPTFILMKQYELAQSHQGIVRLYHADAYRVEEKDFEQLGFAEWLEDEAGVVLLEWPEKIQHLLPEKKIGITFRSLSENEREIILEEN